MLNANRLIVSQIIRQIKEDEAMSDVKWFGNRKAFLAYAKSYKQAAETEFEVKELKEQAEITKKPKKQTKKAAGRDE